MSSLEEKFEMPRRASHISATAESPPNGECEYAEKDGFLKVLRICSLDHSTCQNFDKPHYVANCPVRER